MAWGAEGSPAPHSNLNTFFSGDSAPRPLAAPEALLPFSVLPFSRFVAGSAPPTVGAAAASVPAPGTRTFLNIPSFPGRAHPVDFSERLSYLVLPKKPGRGGTRGRGVGFWPPRRQMVSMWRSGERILKLRAGGEALEAFLPYRKVVGSGKRTSSGKFGLDSSVARGVLPER